MTSHLVSEEVYPLATQDGRAIPLDIAWPLGILSVIFTNSSTPLIDIPAETEIIMCITDISCFIAFDITVPTITDSVHLDNIAFIPGNSSVYLHVPVGTTQIAVMSFDAATGKVLISTLKTWKGLKQQTFAQ